MATQRESGPLWWDREADDQGMPIREDVRAAAHELWPGWCIRVATTLGDAADAPEILESAVAYISRSLTRSRAAPFYPRTKSLLSLHSSQELKRRAGRESRVKAVGLAAELDALSSPSWDWVKEADFWLDFDKLHGEVDDRSWIIFSMRHLGHGWPEVSEKLGIAISTAQNHFRKNFKQAWAKLNARPRTANSNGNGSRR